LVEFLWVVDSSSVYEVGLFHVFGEVVWREFFEFVHSVTSMQQSAFLRHLIVEVAYWILFLKMVFVFDAVWL